MNGAANDPHQPCPGSLRPGRAAYIKSKAGGIDFHIVRVHWDSGMKSTDFTHREVIRKMLHPLLADLSQQHSDADLIVLGDFNTIGVAGGVNEAQEMAAFRQSISTEAPGFRALVPQLECSEFFERDAGCWTTSLSLMIWLSRETRQLSSQVTAAMLDG